MNDDVITTPTEPTEPPQNEPQGEGADIDINLDNIVLEALKNPSNEVSSYINEMVQAQVKKQVKMILAGQTPKRATVKPPVITKKEFQEMTYSQRNDLFMTNRSLYNQLNK